MTAAQFADATYIVPVAAFVLSIFSTDVRGFRLGVALFVVWMAAVVVLACVNG